MNPKLCILLLLGLLCSSSILAVVLENTIVQDTYIYVAPANITRTSALTALQGAELELQQMLADNFSTYLINDSLLRAKRFYIGEDVSLLNQEMPQSSLINKIYLTSLLIVAEETPLYEIERLNYSQVHRYTQLITYRKSQAYQLLDAIPLVEEKELEYRTGRLWPLNSSLGQPWAVWSYSLEMGLEGWAALRFLYLLCKRKSREY